MPILIDGNIRRDPVNRTFPDGIILESGDIDLSGAGTGVYDIILRDAVADALSIRRATTDMMVFDSSTPQITITPALTVTGLITASGGVTANNRITATQDILLEGTGVGVQLGYTPSAHIIPIHVPMTNKSAATSVAGEIFVLDTTTDYAVVAGGTGGNQSHPFVIFTPGAVDAYTTVVIGGRVNVDCDTAAVARGDILVTSNATALKAMANNAQTDPSKIIGIALTAKGAGAAGQVRALIKTY